MISLKRTFLCIGILAIALTVVACGNSGYTSTGSSGGTTPTSTVSIITTATATVNGQSVTILTNTQGRTLYYFKPDTATKTACTGACSGNWPPLLFTGTGTPGSATSLPGTLSVATLENRQQVEYNGHPLYTFGQDTAPGQTNGEGIKGIWFVATPTLSVQGAPQATPTSNGYGY